MTDRERNQLITYFLNIALTTKSEIQASDAVKQADKLIQGAAA